MLLIPAIDIKDGHCVRLKQGDMAQATTFGEDPAAMARSWLQKGARRLHLVDLNGAFAGKPQNLAAVKAIRLVMRKTSALSWARFCGLMSTRIPMLCQQIIRL